MEYPRISNRSRPIGKRTSFIPLRATNSISGLLEKPMIYEEDRNTFSSIQQDRCRDGIVRKKNRIDRMVQSVPKQQMEDESIKLDAERKCNIDGAIKLTSMLQFSQRQGAISSFYVVSSATDRWKRRPRPKENYSLPGQRL